MGEEAVNSIEVSDLPALVRGGYLPKNLYAKALLLFRDKKIWNDWGLRALLALGAGHVIAGIIFFFAYNWNDLSEFTKFGMVFGGMIVSAFAWVGLGLDRPIAKVFGIWLTVLIGVFLAVFDQVFQTPSMLYSGFTQWAILALPFALVSKSLPHWTVWLMVACPAVLMYLGMKLVPLYGESFGIWFLVGLTALFYGLLILYDRVQNMWSDWARAAWFRLLLLFVGLGFSIVTMSIAIWRQDAFLQGFLTLALTAGIFGYVYKINAPKLTHKPQARIACLVLIVSTLGLMIAQIGGRIIVEITDNEFLLALLLGFSMMAGITFALAKLFKHFTVEFADERAMSKSNQREKNIHSINPTTHREVEEFTNKLQLDKAAVAKTLSENSEEEMPWYMEVFIGIAGIVTAILAMAFFGFLLVVSLGVEDEAAVTVLGLFVYSIALYMRHRSQGLFLRHFFNTILMGGGALAIIGAGVMFDGEAGFIVFSMALSIITLWFLRDRILEFLMAAGFAGLMSYSLWHYHVPHPFIWLYILCSVMGIILITQVIKMGAGSKRKPRILTAAGSALLLAPCIFSFFLFAPEFSQNTVSIFGGWVERLASVLVTGGAVWYLNKSREDSNMVSPAPIILVPLLMAMALMPLGSAAALLIMLTGYSLGIRSLATIGVLAQIWYISWYYYDLSMTLLNKSLLLMAFGTLLLIVYGFANKRGEQNA